MKQKCERMAPLITGYLDGELAAQEVTEVEEHLQQCSYCSQRFEAEKRVKMLIRERVPVVKAPAVLHRRIRRRLARAEGRPSFSKLVTALFEYQPVATSLALALIAFLVFLPTFELLRQNAVPEAPRRLALASQASRAEVVGEIICLDCEFLAQSVRSVQHDQRHRLGIKTEDNKVWTFLVSDRYEELGNSVELLRKKARISGIFFSTSHYVKVEEYRLL